MTGPKGFSFVFLDLFTHLFDFFDIFADLARACLGFLERPPRSCEVVQVRSTHGLHNRTAASLDVGGPGPDLTWQRTLAVVVCAALEGVFRDVSNEIEFN